MPVDSPPLPENSALLDMLSLLAEREQGRGLPPVADWHPQHEGQLDMRITQDGRWWYQGSEITRGRMVTLFSKLLRKEPDGRYVLVTPVEKWFIDVEDAPFLVVSMALDQQADEQRLVMRTHTDDVVVVDAAHPLYVEEDEAGNPRPYVIVRANMPGLLTRSIYYELAELCQPRGDEFGLESCGTFFPLGADK